MKYLCCIIMGYIIGCINPSYLLARRNGIDIKKKGSGNAGASNALILFGKISGVVCALIDIFKAYFAIRLAELLFSDLPSVLVVTGASCVLGHIFPFYMKFRGGKGLACLGGTILAYDWLVFLSMLGAELVLVLVVNYICIVPMTASVAFAVIYGIMTKDIIGSVILALIALVMICKHFDNIKRIKNGTEARFSYLWNKKERERVAENISKQ